jgi:hypothetical protein
MDRYISFQSFIVLKKSKLSVSSLTTWLTFITNRIRILELYKTRGFSSILSFLQAKAENALMQVSDIVCTFQFVVHS